MTQDNMNVEQKTKWLDNQLENLPELRCYREFKNTRVSIRKASIFPLYCFKNEKRFILFCKID